jgi:hypothetical protein
MGALMHYHMVSGARKGRYRGVGKVARDWRYPHPHRGIRLAGDWQLRRHWRCASDVVGSSPLLVSTSPVVGIIRTLCLFHLNGRL